MGIGAHDFNPSTQEVGQEVPVEPILLSESQDTQGYIGTLSFKRNYLYNAYRV